MRGFTLVEIIVSLSIISLLAGMTFYSYKNLQVNNDFFYSQQIIIKALRRAQFSSQAVYHDDAWGVHLNGQQVIIFKGSDFNNRLVDFDEKFTLPKNIILSGLEDIKFNKFDGLPSSAGEIMISYLNETKTIVINQKGTISY